VPWTPDQQRITPQDVAALKTRVNALLALRSVRGTNAARHNKKAPVAGGLSVFQPLQQRPYS